LQTTEEGEHAKGTWYTNLFRAAIYPRMFYEIDDDGKPFHYSPYDSKGGVFAGRGASDSGFWDAYRTVYPLNSLLHTKQWGKYTSNMLVLVAFLFFGRLLVIYGPFFDRGSL
jgi:putative alpha-1,2-mannosidase